MPTIAIQKDGDDIVIQEYVGTNMLACCYENKGDVVGKIAELIFSDFFEQEDEE